MANNGGSSREHKLPPAWGPDSRDRTFKQWVGDIRMWMRATEMKPELIVPNIIMQLKGLAKDVGNQMTDDELRHGSFVEGIRVSPLTLLLKRLNSIERRFDS